MKQDFKNLFKTKPGVLTLLTIGMALSIAYLNIITIKSLVIEGLGNFEISYGTLMVSFIPMLIGDLLAECYGWKKSFLVSSVAYLLSLIFVLILWGVALLPGTVFGGFGTEAFTTIFTSQPLLLFASAIAYYAGIFFNCYIMGAMKKRAIAKGKDGSFAFFARCILSTVVGQLLDNALFFLIGYAPDMADPATKAWAVTYVWQQILAAFVFENVYEIILFPVTKILTKKVKSLPEVEIITEAAVKDEKEEVFEEETKQVAEDTVEEIEVKEEA